MIILTKSEIIKMQEKLIDKFGGEYGIRDENLLDSAVNAPYATFFGEDLYPTTIEKIVRLSFGLTMNHPFIDGNKRIGALSLLVLLRANNVNFEPTEDELTTAFLSLASGEIDYEKLLEFVRAHEK